MLKELGFYDSPRTILYYLYRDRRVNERLACGMEPGAANINLSSARFLLQFNNYMRDMPRLERAAAYLRAIELILWERLFHAPRYQRLIPRILAHDPEASKDLARLSRQHQEKICKLFEGQ
ncbi:hypothetical protein AGMMS49992_32960 [Clostridia bacterium]|nr:hypothetical protein AGMMS49992_32960 [Clostridia bacterium]